MDGTEKEMKKQNRREKHSVASTNQTANQAVLNCLKTMMHNINSAGVVPNVSSCSDDEVSELSLVSHAKYPERDQLKHVPFRRHKIIMILNKLFLQNSMVKVTLLLTAYPGHIDFQQKRMLLQDVEMLHGYNFANSSNASIKEADCPNQMKVENNNKKELKSIRSKQKRTVKLATSFEQGHGTNYHLHLSNDPLNKDQKIKTRTPRTAQRIPRVKPIGRNSKSIGSPTKPSAPIMMTQKDENLASKESFGFVEKKSSAECSITS